MSTEEEWGLIQNTCKIRDPGWPAEFIVDNIIYLGKAWAVSSSMMNAVLRKRQAKMATKVRNTKWNNRGWSVRGEA
jgi:hypothetical protein